MKRLLGILMILILIAGVFVSCSQDKIEEAVISGEELLDVSFGASSDRARDLVVDTPEFNDGDYVWYYTAKKVDATGFNTGETSVLTPVKDPAAAQTVADRKGLKGAVISGLSQGYWDFGLYAYVPVEDVQHDYKNDDVSWQGSVSHFLLVKGAANVVDVTVSPVTAGKGWLVVDTARIVVKDANGHLVPVTSQTGTSLAYTVTRVGGTEPVDITEAIDAGAYLVKVVCTGSNIDYAEDSIVVNVYGGLTRTVWGSIGELTTSAVFGDVTAEIIEATTGSKTAEELLALKAQNKNVDFTTQGTIPVTATLPASAAVDLLPTVDPGTDLDLTLTLNVKADTETTEETVTTKSYDITLVQKLVETTGSASTTTVSDVTSVLTEYLTATLTIDKNLSAVTVKHTVGETKKSMLNLNGSPAPSSEQITADAAAGYPGFYNYDSATGVLTLITKKFSPFDVSYTKPVSGIAEVSRLEGSILKPVANCKSLDDAFELALDGDIVLVLEDTSLGSTKTVSKEIVIRAVDKIKDVTDPLALAGRGYEGTYDSEHKALTITKTPITDAVARIDEGDDHLYFTNLQKAFDSAIAGDTVVLLKNVEVQSPVENARGKNTIFDLNGFELSAALKETGRHYYAIENYGTITIKDSEPDGKIIARGIENLGGTMTIESGKFYSIDGNGCACVWNENEYIYDDNAPIFICSVNFGPSDPIDQAGLAYLLAQGKILIDEVTDDYLDLGWVDFPPEIDPDNLGYGCYWYIRKVDATVRVAKLTINGGSFIVSGGTPTEQSGAACINSREGTVLSINNATIATSDNSRCYAIIANGTTVINNTTVNGTHGALATDGGFLTINSGTFNASNYYGLWITNNSVGGTNVVINGGNFNGGSVDGGKYALYAAVDDGHQDMSDVSVEIKDGTFIGYGTSNAIAMNPGTSTHTWELTVTGGLYSTDPSVYVADGYTAVAQGTDPETWVVKKADVKIQSGTETVAYMTLGQFRDAVNAGTGYAGKTVTLLNDVDLNNEEWKPIGTSTHPFNGVFDGQDHKIENLKVTETGKFSGLFGVVCGSGPNTQFDEIGDVLNLDSNTLVSDLDTKIIADNYRAVVENLIIDGFTVNCWIEDADNEANARFSGALVGSAQYAYIGNCDVTNGTVIGCKAFGGVIGSIDGSAVVDCNTSANVNVIAKANLVGKEAGAFNFGGIVGATSYGFSSTYGRSIVKDCTNKATLIKTDGEEKGSIAGIVGFGQNGGYATPSIIVGCAHEGKISCSVNVSDIAGISTVSNHVLYYVNCTNNDDFSFVTVAPSMNAGIATGAPGNNHDRRVINCASCELKAPTHVDERWSQILNCGNDTKKIVNCSYGETEGIYYPPIN